MSQLKSYKYHIRRRARDSGGTSLTEAIVAAIVIVPVALFLLDLSVLIIANSINDKAAKNAARAAANHDNVNDAFKAANRSMRSFKRSPIVKSLRISNFRFPGSGNLTAVSCTTRMRVKLPVPFPGFDNITFVAQAVEPIVGQTNP